VTDRVLLAAARLDVEADELARLERRLAPDERERAAGFVFARDCRRYTVARARLREWLAELLGVAPEALVFAYGAQGKPRLEGGPHFNLSHSGERALFASCAGAPVGVDVEVRREVDPLALARSVFSPAEQAALAAQPEQRRQQAFFATWTRKEAVIKATGLGVSQGLERFSVLETDGGLVLAGDPAVGAPADWTVVDVALEPGYPAALAVIARAAPVSALRWLGV